VASNADIPRLILDQGLRFCAPFSWFSPTSKLPDDIRGASFFALKSDKALFGVTADHVLQECLDAMKMDASTGCFLKLKRIDIENRIISRSHENKLDIATFTLFENDLQEIEMDSMRYDDECREQILNKGDPIQLVGLLEGKRHLVAPRHVAFDAYGALAIVEDVSSSEVIVAYDPKNVEYGSLGLQRPPQGMSMSGCSGGPAMLYEKRRGIWRWIPIGLIFRGPGDGKDMTQNEFDLIRIRRLLNVDKTGQINEIQDGWLPA
jgi:hypothetical protein